MKGEGVKSMGCGLGELDYSSIVKFALDNKPYIHATLEDTTPDVAVSSRECIEKAEKAYMEK